MRAIPRRPSSGRRRRSRFSGDRFLDYGSKPQQGVSISERTGDGMVLRGCYETNWPQGANTGRRLTDYALSLRDTSRCGAATLVTARFGGLDRGGSIFGWGEEVGKAQGFASGVHRSIGIWGGVVVRYGKE